MTPTPRAQLKALFAAILNMAGPCVVWKGEPEPAALPPPATFGAITGATNASPIVLTVTSTAALANGHQLVVAGVGGNTAANGTWPITVVDSTHISLNGSTGNNPYTSGGTLNPVSPFLWAMLKVGASAREFVGWDNLRRTDNLDGTYTEQTDGRRRITLGCDLFTYTSELALMADDMLELLRTRLWQPSNLLVLNSMGLSFETCGSILQLPTTVNGRDISAAHVDLIVALGNIDTAVPDPYGNTWIGEVTGTGTVTTGEGVVVSPTFDVTGG